jgi:hypothetical protein
MPAAIATEVTRSKGPGSPALTGAFFISPPIYLPINSMLFYDEDMKQNVKRRYVAKNAQLGSDTGLGKIRNLWQVLDTATDRIVDEYQSGRAARSAAAHYNKYGISGEQS